MRWVPSWRLLTVSLRRVRCLRVLGPNAVRSYGARAFPVLGRQPRSPLLILLAVTACASFFIGKRSDAVIIGVILLASVGLGFVNEYRAEKAAEALHSSIRHRCVVLRSGQPQSADVTELVCGDVIDLQLGEVVPADVRLLATAGLECEKSVLTGESVPAEKSAEAVPAGTPLAELSCCALMGTVVRAGSGTGVVVATGGRRSSAGSPSASESTSPRPSSRSGCASSPCCSCRSRWCSARPSSSSMWSCTGRSSTRCFSRSPSPSVSPRSCSRRSFPPASPPGHGSWLGARCWSNGWYASRISAT